MNPSIIIPTYTNSKGLIKLLDSLSEYSGEVIVVDNEPSKDKKRILSSLKYGVYLPQTGNLGFAVAVNLGVRRATSKWIAILNDDISLPSQKSLSGLISFAESKSWDAVSPVLQKQDEVIENYGYTVLPAGKVILNLKKSRLDSSFLDGITAACLVIRKSVFEKLGGFDEKFFAYLEDVDLFLRIKKLGFTFGICPEIFVVHEHMSTSGKMGWFKEKQDLVNWIRIIAKNWGWRKIIANLPGILAERLRNLSGFLKKVAKVKRYN